MKRKNGFILEHLLISIFIIGLFLPIVTEAIQQMKINLNYNLRIQDSISLYQIREVLMFAYDIEVYDTYLQFRYKQEVRRLQKIADKLIMQKGTVIYLTELSDAWFVQENGLITLFYRRNNAVYESVLCHV